ncbi:adenylate/guanylate cyclase domain-containing protein [Shimia sp. SDUM112013]|uniref:adenylate/guanylate cyclase domain-containing protein n=1 Tax=Shimia sp. SDUM112013 TaxID=3136160 RepID=UPI0032EF3AA8
MEKALALADISQKVRDYFSVRPDGLSDQEMRMHVMGRVGYPSAFLVHLGFVFIFYALGHMPMFLFNLASVVIWGWAVWIVCVQNRFSVVAYILAVLIEIPLHGVVATLYFGVEPAFFFYIVNSVLMAVIMPFAPRPARAAIAALFVVALALSGAWTLQNGPLTPMGPRFDTLFFAFNSVCLPFLMATMIGLFEWAATTAEKGLMESRFRVEMANQSLENVSRQLAKYISPQLYQAILRGDQEVRVESKRKKLTVFFSDIVGFTETTDQMQSEELTDLLNEYLTEMSRIAQEHGANLDKFIGDAIVLYFGDPDTLGVKQDALQAVRMAIAMQRRMYELRQRWLDQGLERPFEMRIGINTGYCTVGNFGSEDRMDYTIIGGEVNLAARLESAAETGGILLAHETWSLVRDTVLAEPVGEISVKGFAKPVRTYRVAGLYDGLAEKGQIIHHSDDAISLTINRALLKDGKRQEIVALLRSALKDLSAGKG